MSKHLDREGRCTGGLVGGVLQALCAGPPCNSKQARSRESATGVQVAKGYSALPSASDEMTLERVRMVLCKR